MGKSRMTQQCYPVPESAENVQPMDVQMFQGGDVDGGLYSSESLEIGWTQY